MLDTLQVCVQSGVQRWEMGPALVKGGCELSVGHFELELPLGTQAQIWGFKGGWGWRCQVGAFWEWR
jgi:hypothetical protein